MNAILLSHFKKFREEHGFQSASDSEAFEAFAFFLTSKRYHCDQVSFDDSLIGGGNDGGLDAVIILVNGRPIYAEQEIDYIIEKNGTLSIDFIFIQAKNSPKFKSGDIGTFGFGVQQFFADSPSIDLNEQVGNFISLKDRLYSEAILFSENPRVFLYYVTTGKWENQLDPKSRLEETVSTLEEKNLFSEIFTSFKGENELIELSKGLRNRSKATLTLQSCVVLPDINSVETAHVGIVSAKNYLSLITDESGNLIQTVFNDNVRDFQGNNPVNLEIEESINRSDSQDRFILLNNGITIVSQKAKRIGDEFILEGFQVVNGCQTSHILYRNSQNLTESAHLPIKLIATEDEDLTNEIVQATNRQTTVLPEAFESLRKFHKTLEDYYDAQRTHGFDLFYERRSKQFDFQPSIKSRQIISLSRQTQSFVAVFLQEPHSVHRYFGQTLDLFRDKLYLDDHHPEPYFTAAAILAALEDYFAREDVDRKYRRWRYHIGMLFSLKALKQRSPKPNDHRIKKHCEEILSKILDISLSDTLFKQCISVLDSKLIKLPSSQKRDLHHQESIVASLLKGFESSKAVSPPINSEIESDLEVRNLGKISTYDSWKGFGYISREGNDDIYVHSREMKRVPLRFRYRGIPVTFTLGSNNKGSCAIRVELDKEKYEERFENNGARQGSVKES